MEKINVFKISLLSLVFTGLMFVGCQDHELYNPEQGSGEATGPNSFAFGTDKVVEINLDYNVSQGYKVQFEVYTQNPLSQNEAKDYIKDESIMPFLTGVTNENGKFKMSVPLAASIEDLYVYSPNLGVPALLHANVVGESVSAFSIAEVPMQVTTRSSSTAYYKNWKTFTIKNLITDKLEEVGSVNIEEDFGALIDNNLPKEGGSLNTDMIKTTYGRNSLKLKEEGEVKLYFAGHGKNDRVNALTYYTYEGATPELSSVTEDQSFIVAFPELSGSAPNLGVGVQLLYKNKNGELQKTFPANTIISFALLVDAGGTNVKSQNINVVYSEFKKSYNSYYLRRKQGDGVVRGQVPHMIGFKVPGSDDGKTVKVVMGFEDQPWDESPDSYNQGDFRDDVFVLEVNPPSALPDDIPDGTRPDETVPDDGFLYTSGILSFEDSWPDKGDYDLNDVVISYQRKAYFKNYNDGSTFGQNYLTQMDEEYKFLNNGANYTNAFGYEMGLGIKKSDIIKGEVEVTSDYTCSGQELDKDLEKPTVMLFDNSKRCPVGTTFKVHTGFKEGSNIPMMNIYKKDKENAYNPFIVVMGYESGGEFLKTNRKEVHLPQYAPTPKMDMSLFAQEGSDDLSDPEKEIYYVRGGNYPFALDLISAIPGDYPVFAIPVEKKPIDYTYPKFNTWVESNGVDAKDWYTKPEKTE